MGNIADKKNYPDKHPEKSAKAKESLDTTGFLFCPRCQAPLTELTLNRYCPHCGCRFCPGCAE